MLNSHRSNPPLTSPNYGAEALEPMTEKALEWIVFLHSGDESEQDWQAYAEWKHASDDQYIACEQAEALWASIGPAIEKPRLKKYLTQALAVTLMVGGITYTGINQHFLPTPASLLAEHRTSSQQGAVLILDDGSELALDASTSVDIQFTANHRHIILHDGQLHIDVAPDKNRPLLVITDDISVRALGTGFNVKTNRENVNIAVTEHSVLVTDTDTLTDQTPTAELQFGEQLSYSPALGLGQIQKAELRNIMAWQDSRLIFDDQPLQAVFNDLQRYNDKKLIILGDELKQQRITGVFGTQDLNNILQAVEVEFAAKTKQLPGVILIHK